MITSGGGGGGLAGKFDNVILQSPQTWKIMTCTVKGTWTAIPIGIVNYIPIGIDH
jgi:hypothetical protein